MDYIDGITLQQLVEGAGPVDFRLAAEWIAQAADGLHRLHEARLIHRDVKPGHLMVQQNGRVRVIDYGLAMDSRELTITEHADEMVTVDYLAPEQAINAHFIDRRADIYSLGCVLYFLLTGHPPFPRGTLPQRIVAHQMETPPSIYNDRTDAPRRLVEICEQMVAKDPAYRFQTANQVSEALRQWRKDDDRDTRTRYR